MTDGTSRHTETEAVVTERAPDIPINGLIGGVVAIVFSFIPFSPVLGGGVAGYLQGTTYDAGAKAGAIAGLVAFLPFVAILGAVLLFIPVFGGFEPGPQVAFWAVALFVFVVSAVYTIGLSVVGGALGVYVKEDHNY